MTCALFPRRGFHNSIEILATFLYNLGHNPGNEEHSMNKFKASHFLLYLFVFLSLPACVMHHVPPLEKAPEKHARQWDSSGQVLLVTEENFLFFSSTKVYGMEKREGVWRRALDPMKAVVGKNGFAPQNEKREGDGRTPSGLYRMGTAFGYAPSVGTKMPYRQALPEDLWVDDPNAPDYNRWVKQGETSATSYEKMRRDDNQYKYGLVIEYNTQPVIPGRGSAIFLHVWKEPKTPTAGCVAVSEEDILKILDWLNPAASPVIVINPDIN